MEIYTQGFYNCLDFPSKKYIYIYIYILVDIPLCLLNFRENK